MRVTTLRFFAKRIDLLKVKGRRSCSSDAQIKVPLTLLDAASNGTCNTRPKEALAACLILQI